MALRGINISPLIAISFFVFEGGRIYLFIYLGLLFFMNRLSFCCLWREHSSESS